MKRLFYLLSFVFLVSCTSTKVSKYVPDEPLVKIETDSGMMVARLYSKTPLHQDNFVKHVKRHFYDGLLFHRVIKDFIIQGGDSLSRNARPGEQLGEGGAQHTIPAEIDSSLFHKKGALAAAREADDVNPERASSASQFYIVQGKTYTNAELNKIEDHFNIKIPEGHREVYRTIGGSPFLDMSYTVFGQVIYGLDVIDKIAGAATDKNDRPLKDIRMKITLLKRSEYKKYQ